MRRHSWIRPPSLSACCRCKPHAPLPLLLLAVAYDLEDDGGANGNAYMNGVQPIASRLSYAVGPGNHEADADASFTQYQSRWAGVATTAGAASGSGTALYYSYNDGLTHFVVIDTEQVGRAACVPVWGRVQRQSGVCAGAGRRIMGDEALAGDGMIMGGLHVTQSATPAAFPVQFYYGEPAGSATAGIAMPASLPLHRPAPAHPLLPLHRQTRLASLPSTRG